MALYFLPQERIESCLPACLRMILADFGISRSEADIYQCCDTNSGGTLASSAVECAISLGLEASALRLGGIQELQQFIGQPSTHAIVFVNLAPLLGKNTTHAVIATAIDEQSAELHVMDPAYPPTGQRSWSLGQFQLAWQMARFQTIVIRAAQH